MRHLHALVGVVAPSSLPILLLGEGGVGKETFAQTIHKHAERPGARFLSLRCATLPEATLEGEPFTQEERVSAGMAQAKAALFGLSEGGTLFLDEVSALPMPMQVALLRVLESCDVMHEGTSDPSRAIRVIASTSRDLRQLIVEGRFRADLYFRINGMSLTLPPLRRRQADIVPLAGLFLDRAALHLGRPPMLLTDAAMEALERHHWPGNVRELAGVIERAALLCRTDVLDVEQLVASDPEVFGGDPRHDERTDRYELPAASRRMMRAAAVARPTTMPVPPLADETERLAGSDLRSELRTLEKQRIVDALSKTSGNQSQAAKLLGMSRYTLMSRLETYGIARPRKSRA
jgi:DNA-binding NtrC family response regulator